ncbi:hypothetical protein [Streptomyces sp. NRRL S-1022]|uniref:hypothetical protein n=1 Tax=Streptomyces sp. NRRL S-1022 TaxID=1463880 RepID=UPI00131B3481|nr:hypothetical protein [Streptomyces sp. NRRL S-1022]
MLLAVGVRPGDEVVEILVGGAVEHGGCVADTAAGSVAVREPGEQDVGAGRLERFHDRDGSCDGFADVQVADTPLGSSSPLKAIPSTFQR